MSAEENKDIIRRHVEAWSSQDPIVAIDELVATDFNGNPEGKDEFRRFFTKQANEYPDRTYTIVDMIAEGDKVAVRLTYRYTDPATGKQMGMSGTNLYRIHVGKMQNLWAAWPEAKPI